MKKFTDKQLLEGTRTLLLSYDNDIGKLLKKVKKALKILKKPKKSTFYDGAIYGLCEERRVKIEQATKILEKILEG